VVRTAGKRYVPDRREVEGGEALRMLAGGGSGQGNARQRFPCTSFVAVPSS